MLRIAIANAQPQLPVARGRHQSRASGKTIVNGR